MKRFLAVLFWLVPLMGFSQQPNQVMAFSDGRMATPTNLFKTNIYSGTNIYAESYGSKGEVRINVVGSLGGNSSILINGISKTNANFNATAPGVGLVGSAPVLWNVSGTNVTGYIYPASKNDPGVLPAGTGNSFKIPKTDIDGNWTLSDPGGGVTAIDNLTNANHFFLLLTNNVPGPYVTTNNTNTTIFYLPYASWTNVGLLTSNDWQTFNGKASSNYVETLSGTNGMFVRTEIVSYSNTVNTRLGTVGLNATNYTDNHSNFIVATFGDVIVSNTITTGTNEAGMVVLNGPFSTPVRSDYLTNKTLTLDVTTNCTHELITNSHFGVAFGGTPSAGAILVLAVSNSSPSSVINLTNPATVMTKYPVVGVPPGQWTFLSWQWEGSFWWFTGDPFATNSPTAGQILYSDGTARYWSNAPTFGNISYTVYPATPDIQLTNYTLIAGTGENSLLGSNVNIVAIMGGTANAAYDMLIVTNGTGANWGISFSAVSNRWAWCYGQAAPSVLTNGTQLIISTRTVNTNVLAGYAYAPWP